METNEISGEWTLLSQEEAADVKADCPPLVTEEVTSATREDALPEDKSGSDGSDIAVLDEEDDDDGHSMESSILSQDSSFSFLSASELHRASVEVLHEDLSDRTSTIHEGLNSDVDLKPSVKHYVHTPNTHLNTILNIAVVLTITAVVGLGIGNFIGWSTQHQKHQLLSRSQVLKLRQLQDELVLCMKQQQLANGDKEESKICYRDSEYWKQQFDALFEENQDLKGMLQQVTGESQTPLQCSSDATEEFHKLKLDLIVKQMEHLEVLKNLEEIKFQNMQSKERLKELEEENTELKIKLEEEEHDDQILVAGLEQKMDKLKQENQELKTKLEEEMQDDELLADLESKVSVLTEENRNLKEILEDIRRQVVETSQSPEPPISKADYLKQQVNDIVAENEDLKTTIARIRYGGPGDQHKRQINHLVQENEGLKQEIHKFRNRPDFVPLPSNDKKSDDVSLLQEHIKNLQEILQQDKLVADQWKKMYEEIKQKMDNNRKDGSTWSDLNWADALKNGLQNGTKALTDIVDSIVQFISQPNNTVRKDILSHLNGSKVIFEAFQQNLVNKWEELKSLTKPEKMQKYVDQTRKTIHKMSDVLDNTMRKLHQAGLKFVTGENVKESKADALANKVWKIVDNLEQKWTSLKDKWAEKVTKSNQPQGPPRQNSNKEDNDKSKWYFRRARAREGLHARLQDNGESDWVFKRAQAREQSHMTRQSRLYQDWYTRRGKGRSKTRIEKRQAEDDDSSDSCDDGPEQCDYDLNSWKKESLLNEAGNDHFEQELFSHHGKMYQGHF